MHLRVNKTFYQETNDTKEDSTCVGQGISAWRPPYTKGPSNWQIELSNLLFQIAPTKKEKKEEEDQLT